jgi:endoglucanase
MDEQSVTFLKQLLSIPGPSGDERDVARYWREEAAKCADTVSSDVHGNSFALLTNEVGPRVLLAGHVDEIGLMISYIDDDGYAFFLPVGGWDPQVLVGQRVRLAGRHGEVIGVVGKKPIHLLKAEEREQASKIEQLWIDIGAKSREEAQELIRLGSVGVIDSVLYELPNRRIVSRSLDDRIGAFIVLESLRVLSANRPAAQVAAVATTYEEIGSAGATVAAFRYEPHVAIAVDVTFATDHPDSDKKKLGDVKLGHGPVLSRGSANNVLIFDRLCEIAEREGIPYSVQINPRSTGTDADNIYTTRSGVATTVISVPNRYMHSPNEMVDLADVEYTIRLIVAFVQSVRSEDEFFPR